jgi:hypothetical protein
VASITGGNESEVKFGACKRPDGDIGLAEWLEVGLTMFSIAE